MSSIRLAALALAMSSAGAGAHGVACPAAVEGRRLAFVTVFDGPPSENASLVPDTAGGGRASQTAIWRVAGIYRAGRIVYLSCDYRMAKPVIVPVKRATQCRYAEHGKVKSLSCR